MKSISDVAYYPHAALLCQFSHKEFVRLNLRSKDPDPLLQTANTFSTDCASVRRQLEDGYERLAAQDSSPGTERFPRYLFRPICLAALGQTDDVGLVLIDNLPLALRLTAVNRAMQSAEVSFCPKLDSITLGAQNEIAKYGLTTRSDNDKWPFYELHTLISPQNAPGSSPPESLDWSTSNAMPPDLRETPLCVICRFKFNTLVSLGHASRLSQVVLETVSEKIRQTCCAFLNSDHEQIEIQPFAGKFMTLEDICRLKVVYLEPQSADDLTVIFFCTNYVVPETLIAVLRNLTLGDLWADNGPRAHIGKMIIDEKYGPLHARAAAWAASQSPHRKLRDRIDHIAENHVFMNSYSTLCVNHYAMRHPEDAGVEGWVEAQFNIDEKPGHEREIRNRMERTYANVFAHDSTTPAPPFTPKEAMRMLPGLHDEGLILSANTIEKFQPGALVRTSDAFQFLCQFFAPKDVDSREVGSSTEISETGFLNISTSFVVPIPEIVRNAEGLFDHSGAAVIASKLPKGELLPEVDWSRHLHGAHLFREIREQLECEFFRSPYHRPGDDYGPLDLRDDLRKVGCPSSLQYSLIYLFQEFLACIDDPLQCVAVLDLYDAIILLNDVLRRRLVEYRDKLDDTVERRRELTKIWESAHPSQCNPIREFIDALRRSFTLRLRQSIPRHETRDTAFDFRGGVGKFLAAMDVPLKCSLGLFRRMFDIPAISINEPTFKSCFAAVTSVQIGQQTTAEFGSISQKRLDAPPKIVEDVPAHMATFNLDLMRLFGPDQIVHFLHEFAHLYFDTFVSTNADTFADEFMSKEDFNYSKSNFERGHVEYVRAATQEVFAELVTHLFVFEADTDLFSKFYALSFAEVQESVIRDVTSYGHKDSHERRVNALMEAFYRAFLVANSINYVSRSTTTVAEWPERIESYSLPFDENAVDEAWELFEEYIRTYGPFYSDYRQLWEEPANSETWDRCETRFRSWYGAPKCSTRLDSVWQHAIYVYDRFRRSLLEASETGSSDILPFNLRDLEDDVEACMREGRAYRRMQWPEEVTEDIGGVDSLFVICKVAYTYIRAIYGAISPDKVIFADEEDERLNKESVADDASTQTAKKEFNKFIFDAAHFPLYCVDPDARKDRLLRQISCLKTLCDISSQFRARRLVDMIKLLPKSQATPNDSGTNA